MTTKNSLFSFKKVESYHSFIISVITIIVFFVVLKIDVKSLKENCAETFPVVEKNKTSIIELQTMQKNIERDIGEIKSNMKDIKKDQKEQYQRYEEKITQHYTSIINAISRLNK